MRLATAIRLARRHRRVTRVRSFYRWLRRLGTNESGAVRGAAWEWLGCYVATDPRVRRALGTPPGGVG